MKAVKEIEEMLVAEQTRELRSGAKGPVINFGPPSAQPWDTATISVIARVIHALLEEAVSEAVGTAVRVALERPA